MRTGVNFLQEYISVNVADVVSHLDLYRQLYQRNDWSRWKSQLLQGNHSVLLGDGHCVSNSICSALLQSYPKFLLKTQALHNYRKYALHVSMRSSRECRIFFQLKHNIILKNNPVTFNWLLKV